MRDATVGERRYRVLAAPRGSDWLARAERTDTGNPFGIECAGSTEAEAVERMVRWLEWQHEHACALDSLQRAERVYHRAMAGSAFGATVDGPRSLELRNESLDAVESARVRLDDIRARRPE